MGDDLTDNEILNLALESGIIDIAPIYAKVEELKKKKYYEMHTNKVWQGSKDFWYTYLDYADGRKLIKKKFKEDLDNTIIDFYRDKCESPTFQECFSAWLNSKVDSGEIQKQTYDRYQNDFKRFFTPISVKNINEITEDALYEFIIDTIRDMELTAKAWAGMRTIILGTFKYAKRKHYTDLSISVFMSDLDISRGIFKSRKFTDKESVFTEDEVKTIRKAVEEEGYTMLNLGVLLAFETGLRCGEISALEYKDLKGNVLNVSKTEIHYKDNGKYVYEIRNATKGKYEARSVVLTQRAIQIIETVRMMNPDGRYLFEKNGKRMRGKVFTEKIVRMCRNSGMNPRSLHKCRKTYVTKLADAGISEKVICGQVGHADFSTSRNHYWFNNKTVDEVQKMLAFAME